MRIGQFPVNLDGLLWHALFMKTGDPDKAIAHLKQILEQESGVFRASSMGFLTHYENRGALIATRVSRTGTMRSDTDLLPNQFHPTGRNGNYTKLQVEGGPYKNRLTKHDTYHAPGIYWDAVGDGDTICTLLNFYVFAIGLDANQGFGSVGPFSWEEMQTDSSWQADSHTVARVLPVYIAKEFLGEEDIPLDRLVMAQVYPPYRRGKNELCVAPPRVRRLKVQTPF